MHRRKKQRKVNNTPKKDPFIEFCINGRSKPIIQNRMRWESINKGNTLIPLPWDQQRTADRFDVRLLVQSKADLKGPNMPLRTVYFEHECMAQVERFRDLFITAGHSKNGLH
mmetsp:Transcript_20911/g.23311  ORF Transcript_20911/g.23311 Transcript_20911/m.23311 type:complete len:112 (+) Transcript_20911:64-399(+)